jgi:gliding motility-associated-like protein
MKHYKKITTILIAAFFSIAAYTQWSTSASTDDISCTAATGRVIVEVTNGGPAYNYFLWDDHPFLGSPSLGYPLQITHNFDTAVFSNLTAGTYWVYAQDAISNSLYSVDLISVNSKILTADSIEIVQGPTCINSTDAQLRIHASGGNPPYSYQWSASAGSQTTQTAINLGQGIYRAYVNDSYNCGDSVAVNYRDIVYIKGLPDEKNTIPDSLDGGTIASNQTICAGDTPADLINIALPTGGTGAGYTYDWEYQENCSGVWASLGVNSLSYTFGGPIPNTRCYRRVTNNTCGTVYSNEITITVNPLPTVTLAAFADVCNNDAAFALSGGLPLGGVYSGPGVSAGNFDPAVAGAGTHTITYTYTDGNGCTNFATNTITVNAAPAVTLGAFADVCINAAPFALSGGSPVGGGYSGPGVSAGNFDPAVAGAGTHTITYTYVDGNGCANFAQSTITVYALPTVTLGAFADVCADAAPFALSGGSPVGGTYSGPGVAGGNFDPATAGVGVHTITYSYTDGNGCTNQATNTITVNPLPTVTLAAFADICDNDAAFALSGGLPLGGTYSGPGVSGGNFDPATAGVGTHTITYTFTDGNGCTNFATNTITVNAAPVVTLGAFADVCEDAAPFALTGGSPVGGTYSGPGVAGGNFNPATAGIGTHTITYTFTDGNGCSNQATNTITVNALPTVTLGAFADVCEDAAPFALSGGSPVGGTYSGPGVAGSNFIPIVAGVGVHTITYTYTDGNGCSNQATNTITVNPLPTVTLAAFADVCDNDAAFTLSGGLPLGGSYSGPGVSGGNFDPATAGIGTHTITYTYTDGNGCTDFATNTITVNASPVVTLGVFADVCIDASPFALSGGSPVGGTYSGPGVAAGNFNPATAGVGTHTITYTFTDGNGCSNQATNTITVNALPTVTLGAFADVCIDASPFALSGGSPVGGTYSGPGVAAGNFDPSIAGVGTHTITYTYTDGNGCSNQATNNVTVNALPTVTLGAFADVCIDASPFALSGGSPVGGTYSGPGVAAGNFDPAIAGVGTHTITYTYTDANGCTNFANNTITVNNLPVVTLGAFADVCEDAAPFALSGGSPVGGTYSGPGVSGGNFDPAVAGIGTHTITYTYTDGVGCTNQATNTITVNALPAVTLGAFADVCEDATPFALSGGTPVGGTYAGPGVVAGIFDPALAGAGTHTIIYSYTDGNGCSNQATSTITVNPLPTVTLTAFTDVCENDLAFVLSGGLPVGGTYSGSGVSGGSFDPAVAGVGVHLITYTYTDGNGCTDFATNTITVNAAPLVNLAAFADVCIDEPTFTLSGGFPLGGTYSGTGVSGGDFDPAAAGVGTHTITYTYTDGNGCTNQATNTITVNPLPTVTLAVFADACENDAAFALSGGLPFGGVYSGPGVSAGNFDPAVAGIGTHTITYTYMDGNGCSDQATNTITVNPAPVVTISGPLTVCELSTGNIYTTESGMANYNWSVSVGGTITNGGGVGDDFVEVTWNTPGAQTVSVNYENMFGCTATTPHTENITVNSIPTVIATNNGPVCEGSTLQLNAIALPTLSFSWTGPNGFTSTDQNPLVSLAADTTMDGTYRVDVTDGIGCTSFATTDVVVELAPIVEAGNDTAICSGDNVPINGASVSNASSFSWRPSGDGTFDDPNIINPVYTPGSGDLANGTVTLYLDATGNGPCLLYTDSIVVTLPDAVQPVVGSPAPFPIGANTEVEVCVATSGHTLIMDMGLYLVAPDGTTTVDLKRGLQEYNFFSPDCIPFPPGDVNVCFTTELPITDTLDYCSQASGPYAGNYAATGDWSSIFGMNPAEGGWSVMVRDVSANAGGIDGNITNTSIAFRDIATATGLLKEVKFESGAITLPIVDAADISVIIPRQLTVSCYGECDAEAIVNVIGGTAPYVSYDWTPAPESSNALGDSVLLCADTYTVTVTDALGCMGSTNVTVNTPPEIIIDTLYTIDNLCNADTSAEITIRASRDGLGGLTYVLLPLNDTVAVADSAVFSNLAAGNYTVEVWDDFSCFIDTLVTINEPTTALIDTAFISQSLACFGDTIGEITAVGVGGTTPYTFVLHPTLDTLSSADTARFINLGANDYLVEMYDANLCKADTSDTLRLTVPLPLIIDTVYAPVIQCLGDSVQMTVIATGGVKPYNVTSIVGTDTTRQTTSSDTSYFTVAGGTHYIRVEDEGGCFAYDSLIVQSPVASLQFDSLLVDSVSGCFDNKNGQIAVYASGGWDQKYTYEYNGFAFPIADTNVLNIGQGQYIISVIDSLGCRIDSTVTVYGPDTLILGITVVDAQGITPGSITFNPSGGTAPYRYWVDTVYVHDSIRTDTAYGSDPVFNNLAPGNYFVSVKDTNGCFKDSTVVINSISMDVDVQLVNPLCYFDYGGNSIYIMTFNEGIEPFQITDNNIDKGTNTIHTIYGNAPFTDSILVDSGNHIIQIRDLSGLVFYDTVFADIPQPFYIDSVNVSRKSCPSGAFNHDTVPTWDGAAEIITIGGRGNIDYRLDVFSTPAYRERTSMYVGSDPARTDTVVFDTLGEYTVHTITVTDSAGCTHDWTFAVESYFEIESWMPEDDTTVCAFNRPLIAAGKVTRHDWVNESDPTNLSYGALATWIWNQPGISVVYNEDPVWSNKYPTARPYIVQDSLEIILELKQEYPQDSPYQLCLLHDTVIYYMYDSVGMSFTFDQSDRYTFNEPTNSLFINKGEEYSVELPLGFYYTELDSMNNNGYEHGQRNLQIDTLGISDYYYTKFAWTDQIAIGVTDSGCIEMDTIFIMARDPILADSIYTVFTPNGDLTNDTWTIPNAHQYPNVKVVIFNRWGQVVYERSGYGTREDYVWDGKSMKSGKDLPDGTYFYLIEPNDGVTEPITGSVVIIR